MNRRCVVLFVIANFATSCVPHSPPVVMDDKDLVLSSVYAAIRGNSIESPEDEGRNKRNVRYYTYDDPKGDELFPGYGEIVHPSLSGTGNGVAGSVGKQCKPDLSPAVQSISISDHSWSGIGTSIIHVLKYLIAGLAIVTLPVLLLQAFIVPLKILMGLKSVAIANTAVLGAFLWKYLNQLKRRNEDDDEDEDGNQTGAGSGGAGEMSGTTNNGNDNRFFPFRAEDFESMNEDEIKAALKLLLKRNKRW